MLMRPTSVLTVLLVLAMVASPVFAQINQPSMGQAPSSMERPGTKLPSTPVKGPSFLPVNPELRISKEAELKQRETALSNPERNTQEAKKKFDAEQKQQREQFLQKTKEAKEQRKACLTARQSDIKALERERIAKMKELQAACTPKAVSGSLSKPEKPSLQGLSAEDAKAAREDFQEAVKEYNQQVKTALEECRQGIKEQQQAFREKALTLKEQCSNTERAVLGLSTEIPSDTTLEVSNQ